MSETALAQRLAARQLELLIDSIEAMPEGAYRSFAHWAATSPPAQQRWLRATGFPQLVTLTSATLAGLCPHDDDRAVGALAQLNVFFFYELVSDNLAMRPTRALRDLVRQFCDAALCHIHRGACAASSFTTTAIRLTGQSLRGGDLTELIALYTSDPAVAARINSDVGAPLTANLQALQVVTAMCSAWPLSAYPANSWARRYEAMRTQIDNPPRTFSARLHNATAAINVAPTMAFYLGAISHLHPLPADVPGASRLLAQTAIQVRLLNDVGTMLLEDGPQTRQRLCVKLASSMAPGQLTLGEAVAREYTAHPALVCRLGKDVLFEESNVCLDGLRHRRGTAALDAFASRLERAALAYEAARLPRPPEGIIETVCGRFADIYRHTYRQDFAGPDGDIVRRKRPVGN